MAAIWRAVRRGKSQELNNRAALTAAIHSGDENELIAAISIARQECVQWKGAMSMSHDEMSAKLCTYLTAPFPRKTRQKDEVLVTPLSLARDLRHENMSNRLVRETEKYTKVAAQDKDAQLKVSQSDEERHD